MITFIRIFFIMMMQHGLTADNSVAGIDYSLYAPVMPVTYDQLVFMVRGEEHHAGSVCMGSPYFAGISDVREEEPGVFKVTVSFRKLPAAKVADIVARLGPGTQIIYPQSR